MITNEKQLSITKKQIQNFETSLEQAITNPDPNLHPLLASAQIAALQSQLDDLRAEVTAWIRLPDNAAVGKHLMYVPEGC